MAYSAQALGLRRVAAARLPRLSDRISFLHLDKAKVVQGRTGVIALLENQQEVQIPGGSLAVLLLGPGVSITTPALRTLANSGCVTIVSTGAADGCYATAVPLTSSGKWGCAQATMWAAMDKRIEAAKFLYGQRFGDDLPQDVTLAQLRGLEGQRMKHVYKEQAARAKLDFWRRKVEDKPGTANANLNLGNSILYGVAASVCGALSLNPALGVIHQGAVHAFLFDLADCFKTTVTIPAAFAAHGKHNAAAATRESVRAALKKQKVLRKMTELTLKMLEPHLPSEGDKEVLLDEDKAVEGHKNYAHEAPEGVEVSEKQIYELEDPPDWEPF